MVVSKELMPDLLCGNLIDGINWGDLKNLGPLPPNHCKQSIRDHCNLATVRRNKKVLNPTVQQGRRTRVDLV